MPDAFDVAMGKPWAPAAIVHVTPASGAWSNEVKLRIPPDGYGLIATFAGKERMVWRGWWRRIDRARYNARRKALKICARRRARRGR